MAQGARRIDLAAEVDGRRGRAGRSDGGGRRRPGPSAGTRKAANFGAEGPVRDRQVGLDVDREAGDAEAAAVRAEPGRPGPARLPGDLAQGLDLGRSGPRCSRQA
ncbi:MAG: hypothetical protein MZV64_49550 [Ignavibacteriales bacterium]|nr:hypothetical protein [Ignavibacteriales bacterium]